MKAKTLFLLLPLLAAGCAGDKGSGAARSCPQAAAVRDLVQLADFGRAEKPSQAEFVAAGRIESVQSVCAFEDDAIAVDIDIGMRLFRGARLGGDQIELPYFVAVLGPGNTVVSKENLSVAFSLGSGAQAVEQTEKVRVVIPNPRQRDGREWRVLLGYQLSPEQLAFNRGEFGEPQPLASPAGKVWRGRSK